MADALSIDAFVRHDTTDKIMWGYVRGLRKGLPAVSIQRAIESFAQEIGLSEINVESWKTKYVRMTKEFYEQQRTQPPRSLIEDRP